MTGPAATAQHFAAALRHHRGGQLAEAARLYGQVLAADGGHADSLHLLGVVARQMGRPDLAIEMIGQAIGRADDVAAYHASLGLAQAEQGRMAAAIASFRRAVALAPDDPQAQYNLGVALAPDRPGDAEIHLRRAVELRPDDAAALANLGIVLHRQGRFGLAETCLRRVVALRPDDAQAHNNLAVLLRDQGRLEASAAAFATSLRLRPDDPLTLNNAASLHQALGQTEAAIACCRRALELRPDFAEALYNLGTVLSGLGQVREAIACLRRAVALRPEDALACSNLGATLCEDGAAAEALDWLRRAVALRPDYAEAHDNLGVALARTGQLEAAVACYRRAIALRPGDARPHNNLAQALLALGDLPAGWAEMEWRWRTPGLRGEARDFAQPQWRGQPAAGATLLIHAEQGYGDTLQFCRYVPLVAARGLRVVLEVQPALLRLLRGLEGVAHLLARGEALPAFDLHCPMLSLPLALGTTLASVPPPHPSLRADPPAVAAMGARLAAITGEGPRVGLAWAGNPRAHLPGMAAVDRRRSLDPALLAPLFAIPGVHFVSLQKGGPPALPDWPLADLMAEMADFADTAALAATLDLVIAADTAVAHLAASLGRPVWLLDRFDHCWRWLAGRRDSPWYPGLRIYRQPGAGDWPAVIAEVARDLAAWASR